MKEIQPEEGAHYTMRGTFGATDFTESCYVNTVTMTNGGWLKPKGYVYYSRLPGGGFEKGMTIEEFYKRVIRKIKTTNQIDRLQNLVVGQARAFTTGIIIIEIPETLKSNAMDLISNKEMMIQYLKENRNKVPDF